MGSRHTCHCATVTVPLLGTRVRSLPLGDAGRLMRPEMVPWRRTKPAGASAVSRMIPGTTGGVTEHRRSGFRPRCREHLTGGRQAILSARHWARDIGSGLPGTAGAEGQQWPYIASARRISSSGSRKWSATLAKAALRPARLATNERRQLWKLLRGARSSLVLSRKPSRRPGPVLHPLEPLEPGLYQCGQLIDVLLGQVGQ